MSRRILRFFFLPSALAGVAAEASSLSVSVFSSFFLPFFLGFSWTGIFRALREMEVKKSRKNYLFNVADILGSFFVVFVLTGGKTCA